VTGLGRTLWWTVLATASAGLLLSLVVLIRPSAPDAGTPELREVFGRAAVAADRGPRVERRVVLRPASTGRREAPRIGREDASPGRVVRSVPPDRVSVPSLGLDLDVRPTGVEEGGQMRLPADPRVLGWYRYGSAPGSGAGAAVLAGHVDSRRYGVGPLAALGAVRPGARVVVELASGRRTAYRVDSIQRFDRQALPAGVFARSGPERLRLVTCTGAFLPEAGGYQQNLVVTAVPVGPGS
jgi:hypothetical protein